MMVDSYNSWHWQQFGDVTYTYCIHEQGYSLLSHKSHGNVVLHIAQIKCAYTIVREKHSRVHYSRYSWRRTALREYHKCISLNIRNMYTHSEHSTIINNIRGNMNFLLKLTFILIVTTFDHFSQQCYRTNLHQMTLNIS